MIERRKVEGGAEGHGGGGAIEEVDAGFAVVKGELASGAAEVDEPGGFIVGSDQLFGGGSGRMAVNGSDEGSIEGGEVLGHSGTVPEEGVMALLSGDVFGIPEFGSAGAGGVAVEPAMTNNPAFGGGADPFGVAEEGFGGAVAVEGGLATILEPFVPFGCVAGSGAGRVTMTGRPIDRVDKEFFVVSSKVVEVVLTVNRTEFGEEWARVGAVVDNITEEDEVMGGRGCEREGSVEAGEGAVEVRDCHSWQGIACGHGLSVGG